MKNKINIRLIIFIAIIVIAIVAVIFGIAKGVKARKASTGLREVTPDEYKQVVEKEGYVINDTTETLANYPYIKSAIMAVSEDSTYEIEYYLFEDEKDSFNFLENKKMAISMLAGDKGTEDSVEEGKYARYCVQTDQYYCAVFVYGKSVVCSDVKIDLKDTVDNIARKLGYLE